MVRGNGRSSSSSSSSDCGIKSGGSGEYNVSVSKVNWNWTWGKIRKKLAKRWVFIYCLIYVTFFFSSTEMALASFKNMALPHRSSRSEVNWWYFHFLKAQAASCNSLSVQVQAASNNGFTKMSSSVLKSSGVYELYIDIVILCSSTCFCSASIRASYVCKIKIKVIN